MTFWFLTSLLLSALMSGPTTPRIDRSAVFDMEGGRILQDEDHVGIINGKLTAGINYRDVVGIGGLWAPPYVSSNFLLDGRVNGEKAPTSKWTWRPFRWSAQELWAELPSRPRRH